MQTATTALSERIAAGDLDRLPHEWDTQYELVGGILFMSRRPSFEHQEVIARFLIRMGPAVLEHGGHMVPEPGIVWELDGDDNVSPDLAVLLSVSPPKRGEKLRTCPDLVIEILSKGESARRRDLEAKRDLYWRRGAREYWIVNAEEQYILRLTRADEKWSEERVASRQIIKTDLLPRWPGIAVSELL